MEEEMKKDDHVVETPTEETKANAVSSDVEIPAKFKKIVEEIEKMSVLDLHELVKVFEKKFDVSAVAVAGPAIAGAAEEAGGGMVSVSLEDIGGEKIQVIKAVKEILGLGLKDAKDLVDAAPSVIKEGIPSDEATEIKEKLEAAGAKAAVK